MRESSLIYVSIKESFMAKAILCLFVALYIIVHRTISQYRKRKRIRLGWIKTSQLL